MMLRLFRYLWASPVTALGMVCIPIAWLTGGRSRIVGGAIEVHGGMIGAILRRGLPVLGSAAAMTLGHVIVGRDQQCLDHSRAHEHIHIKQYERWGIFMLPFYFAASGVLYLRGMDPYLDNPFEREAFQKAP